MNRDRYQILYIGWNSQSGVTGSLGTNAQGDGAVDSNSKGMG